MNQNQAQRTPHAATQVGGTSQISMFQINIRPDPRIGAGSGSIDIPDVPDIRGRRRPAPRARGPHAPQAAGTGGASRARAGPMGLAPKPGVTAVGSIINNADIDARSAMRPYAHMHAYVHVAAMAMRGMRMRRPGAGPASSSHGAGGAAAGNAAMPCARACMRARIARMKCYGPPGPPVTHPRGAKLACAKGDGRIAGHVAMPALVCHARHCRQLPHELIWHSS
jgi:hypothetical protein